ncbi:phage major capsid protein [Sphingobium lactosutens]|uniref:phage major capsid protein n=1 Tax=Sphingobium lactosutens TaxID=522773 RepID=UPI0015BD7AB1|nr:phage major capsid protein [Sphingobium lactosutens]
MNEENINKLFAELATKANSDDAVNKAEVQNLYAEIKSLREEQAEHAAQIEAANEALARKSTTKAQTADASDDARIAAFAFAKGRFAIEDGDVKNDEFSRTVNVEGGHTVPTVIDSEITRALRKASPVRALARVIAAKGNYERLIKVRNPESVAKTKAEKAAYTLNKTDAFAKLHWGMADVVDQQRHTAWVSDEPESILNLAQELQDAMVQNIVEKESELFLTGVTANRVEDIAGVTTTPCGLLAQTATTGAVTKFTDEFGKMATVAQPATSKISDALLVLLSTLHSAYRANAVFLISSDTELKLMQEKDANGRAVWSPADASISTLPGGTVHGVRYVVDDMMPTVADAIEDGTPVALLGDFAKAYTIVDYGTTKWTVDPITEPQFVKYSARRRSGAAIVDYKALRALVLTA